MNLNFGDKLHIAGVPYLFISERDEIVTSVSQDGVVGFCVKEMFDEFKPDPVEKRAEMLLSCWERQSLDHAYDHESTKTTLDEVIKFMENNKDEIISILGG